MDLPCLLVLPVTFQFKRPVKLDGPGAGAVVGTAAAIPAFFRVQDNRRFASLGMRYIHIDLAYFYTDVAPVADIRIEYDRLVRRRDIRNSKNFILGHVLLQK